MVDGRCHQTPAPSNGFHSAASVLSVANSRNRWNIFAGNIFGGGFELAASISIPVLISVGLRVKIALHRLLITASPGGANH